MNIYFSIVVPLYNKQNTILRALNSIRNQIYNNFEVIIVNDGSTDKSLDVVVNWIKSLIDHEKHKYRLINQKNKGVSVARNTGIIHAKYDYIAFLDADDFWEENHLVNIIGLINKYSNKVDIFSSRGKQLQNGEYIYPKLSNYYNYIGIVDFFKVSLISNGFINSSSVCIKKEVLKNNLFPVGMKNFEDIITWARIANNKGFAFSYEATSVYVIEHAEASRIIDFENYLRFEELFKTINYNRFLLKLYYIKFILLHILYARMNMKLANYIQNSLKIFGKSFVVSCCLIFGLCTPKFLLYRLRNIRKGKQ